MKAFLFVLLSMLGGAVVVGKEKPPVIHRIPLPPKPDFSELDWMTGEWAGKTTEKGPQGEISLTVSLDLDKRFMILREQVSLAATAPLPESKETWMGILSPDRSAASFVLRVFSDTGFITRYRATVEAGTVSFNPEGGEQPPAGWLFRRVIRRVDVGQLLETVQVAPPDKPFFDYYTALLSRKGTP